MKVFEVGSRVKLLENEYSGICGSLNMQPGETGTVSEIAANGVDVYVIMDNDEELFPYYCYQRELETY